MKKLTLLTTAALAGTLAWNTMAQAQPDPNNAPKGENTPNAKPRVTPEKMAEWRKQNEARRKQWREKVVRIGMEQLGYNDKTMQDAVIEHLAVTDELDEKMQTYQFQVMQSMMALNDKEAATLLEQYKTATEDYQKKRREADAELEKKIAYSTKPKLEMGLRLIGAIGDNASGRNLLSMMGQGGG